MKSTLKYARVSFGTLFLFIAFSIGTFGQEFRGTITGTVSDPNGAIVAGATVVVRNIETNVSQTVTTNDEGSYTVPFLVPGTYSITATNQGFKTSTREKVTVNVDDRLTVDFQMEIGASAEVNIIADTELLERGSVSTGLVVTQRQIEELPMPEGAAYNLATQAPGVIYTGNPQFSGPTANGNLAAFRTNGAGGNQINLDGSPNLNFDQSIAYTPPADAVSQFKIQTSSFDAQNGFTAGSTVNVAIKSGTNKLHGSGYYFDRDKIFTANNFYSNKNGIERPDRKYYRYGGQVNGPVYIPYLFNGKDRTFFMFAYEKQYNKKAEPEIYSVPTLAMRSGDFSALLPTTLIYDPVTAVQLNSTCTPGSTGTTVCRTPFAGNIIPANRINPAARAFLNLYPEPNLPGTTANFFSNTLSTQPYDTFLTRIDHNFNDNHRIFGKFFYSKATEDRYNFIETPDAYTRGNELRTNKGGSVDYTATLSSNFIVDIRSSLNDFVQERIPVNPISAADLGFAGIAAISDSTMLPRFNLTNYEVLGPQRSDYNEGLTRNFRLFSIQPTVTQIFGNHTLKYGYDFRRLMENRSTNNNNAGVFTFGGNFTAQASNSGSTAFNAPGRDVASFLLGIPVSGSIDSTPAIYKVGSDYHGFFIQDDWRISQKLTVNLGLRYELEGGVKESEGRIIGGFDTTTPHPLRSAALANYNANVPSGIPITAFQNLTGGLTFVDGNDPNQGSDKNNFQPRIGVSYAVDDKTVIRGGFGIFTAPFQIQAVNQTGFTAITIFPASTNNGLTFPANINSPFPSGLASAPGSSLGLATSLGTALGAIATTGPSAAILAHERKNASYARLVFGIQRELPYKIGVEATVVWSRGYDLPVLRQLNYVPRQYLNDLEGVSDFNTISNPTTGAIVTVNNFLNGTVANPFRNLGLPSPFSGSTATRRLLLTNHPQFQDVVRTEYNGSSDYRALQLQAVKRFMQGLSLNASYTYNRDREKTRRLNPQDEELADQLSIFSRPHRIALSAIYELPIGKNRWIGKDWNGWMDAFIGGWQFQAVFERQSGEPLIFGNVYFNGNPEQLKNLLGKKDAEGRRYGVDIPAFDTEGFILINPLTNARTAPAFGNNYQVGGQNTLRYFPYTINNLRNQPFQKFDMGFTKNFRIREDMKFQLRIEAINALNWVYFTGLNLSPSNGTNANPSLRTFGFATSQRNLPRDIQIGGRFTF